MKAYIAFQKVCFLWFDQVDLYVVAHFKNTNDWLVDRLWGSVIEYEINCTQTVPVEKEAIKTQLSLAFCVCGIISKQYLSMRWQFMC